MRAQRAAALVLIAVVLTAAPSVASARDAPGVRKATAAKITLRISRLQELRGKVDQSTAMPAAPRAVLDQLLDDELGGLSTMATENAAGTDRSTLGQSSLSVERLRTLRLPT